MLLRLLQTHTFKPMILVKMAAILFLCKLVYKTKEMTFIYSSYPNMIKSYLFKYD